MESCVSRTVIEAVHLHLSLNLHPHLPLNLHPHLPLNLHPHLTLNLHLHLSLNHEGRWDTTDDFTTSFLHFPCSPLPSGTWRTPGLSIPWCLPTSSAVCLVFVPLSLCLARCFWSDLMNGRHFHATSVCVSTMVRRSLYGPIACWILPWTSSLVTCLFLWDA